MDVLTLLTGIGIIVGLVGVIVPGLPGTLLVWASVTAWALFGDDALRWPLLVVAAAIFAAATLLKYLVPGRRLVDAGVPGRAIVAGVLLGVVGFFVIPVVGLPLGFVAGIFLVELVRRSSMRDAWAATVHALKAVGLSILIELGAGLLIASMWLLAVLA